jgi:membrane protease YdiL (CAAX protease family)
VHLLSSVSSWILALYLIWESARSPKVYRKLKASIDAGDTTARSKFYYQVYLFEALSAALALTALGFNWNALNPSHLGMDHSSFGIWWHAPFARQDNSFLVGAGIGFGAAIVGIVIALKVASRRASQPASATPRQSRFFPNFSYLLPTSARERLLFALVAVSAGVCEEIVFRAWLLNSLHSFGQLEGWTLVLVASVLFGVAHYYQGIAGVVATTILAVFFCGLYVGTGTILFPTVFHTLVDLRWAVFPSMPGIAPRVPETRPGHP